VKRLFMPIIISVSIYACGWYADITFDASRSYFFDDLSVAVHYHYTLLGREEQGLLDVCVKNSSNLAVKVLPELKGASFFITSPTSPIAKPVKVLPKSELHFFAFFIPSSTNLILSADGKKLYMDLSWINSRISQEKKSWMYPHIRNLLIFIISLGVGVLIILFVKSNL